jgi:regulator of nucleoside diphosphate kinase
MEEAMPPQPARLITELDAARIRELRARHNLAALAGLVELVESEAEIVPGARIGPDVVTVNSTLSFRDEVTGTVHRVTVVYPQDMSVSRRRISLLSPVGQALLGQRVGRVVEAQLPDGSRRGLRILEIHYQPESSGHFTT